ncbi:MAG TPA: dihydroneopterin aldolase [Alphaproteobacteria bacterium]|nr:dihydroneopterin aldolase [Alphaproteobacteria bacterium]
MAAFTIFVRQLEIVMSVGIYPHEKTAAQRVVLDIEVECDAPNVRDEDIDSTVSYEVLVNEARALAANKHYNLLETYVQELSEILLKDGRVKNVGITCEKPDYFKGNPKSVGVRISRT